MSHEPESAAVDADIEALHKMGYGQELLRRMGGFSNYAIALSIICILAGGITSFHLGFSAVGGPAIGIGWLVSSLISLCFALTMGQLASAHPVAGGVYHWASILGGRGWGWATAWFNLLGMITVLAAIDVGVFQFAYGSFGPYFSLPTFDPNNFQHQLIQFACVGPILISQAVLNHLNIKLTTLLTDFSGWLILFVSLALTAALFFMAPSHDFSRLWTFTNFSGPAGGGIWPKTGNMTWLFMLGMMLPLYTITGFDASANTSEETVNAARTVPKSIVQAVIVSGLSGWVMLCAVVLAMPNIAEAAAKGSGALAWTMSQVLPAPLPLLFYVGMVIAQYLCGLATLTSASRMVFSFARDGGLPISEKLKQVSPRFRTPAAAIWAVALLSLSFTILTPVYSTITAACVIFLYISYMLPAALGLRAFGKSWTEMGPWNLGGLYRPLAAICVLSCLLIIVIGVQPPNAAALPMLAGTAGVMLVTWFTYARKVFNGPPLGHDIADRQDEIADAERKVGQTGDLPQVG